jgi:tetratricopeptide (TPR) repeat protein
MSVLCLVLLAALSGVVAARPLFMAQQQEAIPVDSQDAPAELANLEVQIRDARYLEAVPALRAYLLHYPSSWRAHYDLGYSLFRARGGAAQLEDNIKESIRELSQSLQLNMGNADAHRILGLDLTMIQRDDLARVEFEQAVRIDPGSAENHYFLGRYFMGRSDDANAVNELETAIKIDPKYMKGYDNLGICLDRLGNPNAALKDLTMAVQLDDTEEQPSELPYLDLAKFYHAHNDLGRALELAQKAADRNPRSEESLLELGQIYRAQSEWKKALDVLLEAHKLNPHTAETYYLLGRTYHALGNEAASRQAFEDFTMYRRVSEQAAFSATLPH